MIRGVFRRISRGYTVGVRKVLVSLPETDLRVIDAAARKAGETRSSFVRRAALAEARRLTRPIDDPKTRRAFSKLVSRAEHRKPISTADALAARDRGRR
jgi:metal-responsive CopG/Arc/MetJ family transcriptional regulator